MPKNIQTVPTIFQSLSLCCIAVWWVLFLSWQPGMIERFESLAYRFDPPSISRDTIAPATKRALEYVTKGPAVIQSDIFFTKDEVSHLSDVSLVYKSVGVTTGISALCGWIILLGVLLQKKHFSRRIFSRARTIMTFAAFCTFFAFVLFPSFFISFHHLLFPQGNWEFPDTSVLIQLFPEAFWKLMVVWIFLGTLLFAALFHVIARTALHDENE